MAGRIILAYKNFAANRNISHIGLGVAALNTSKTLRRRGYRTEVWPILNATDLHDLLAKNNDVSHVVICAPWIPLTELQILVGKHPDVVFAVNCHSNVGFLQADSNGVGLLRGGIDMEKGTHNFHVAGNSHKFVAWVESAYNVPCSYLPNLYYTDHTSGHPRPLHNGGTLRIGMFGAVRPLKNLLTGTAAAIEIAHTMKMETELWYSGGRSEGDTGTIIRAMQNLTTGLPLLKLCINNWQSWPEFVRHVHSMHLLLQPSYTESFNMVTADGISKGVPSVVSPAIDWTPALWQAPDADDPMDIANRGRLLLHDHTAAAKGKAALEAYNQRGLHSWTSFLAGHPHEPRMNS